MTEISSTFAAVNRITSVDDGIKLWLSTYWAKNSLAVNLLRTPCISLNLLTGLPVASAVYNFFFLSGWGVLLGSRSGGVPSASSNLYSISEQYL